MSAWLLRLSDLRELGGIGLERPRVQEALRRPPAWAAAAPGEGVMLMVRLALPHAQMAVSCSPKGMDGNWAR